ncbi:MAG TPA: DNA polymerase III subunit gamma/tau [Nitratifractor sp.]|nr:DNA polymerase III subunit gamma/tau [Nitratifractor sp.]
MALALARKYRPSTFSDLIGQESVSKTLSLALESEKLSHAYLFSGIRGSGKTSTARIFAKALLCEKGPTNNPCQVCEHCVMANEGRHMDIIEMDAASNRGIEDIKELIEHTKYKPSMGRFKIFIIDEVHMLTVQAFNALLKTLEEPPEFVKFILATTDPLKLPSTILSRTQHFRFKKLPQKVIGEHLGFILGKEGVEYNDDALQIIARSAQGSMRDALTLLDQAIVYADGLIDTPSVTNMLGVVDPEVLESLISSILNKRKEEIIAFTNEYAAYEAEMIIDELTLHLRDKLLNGAPELTTLTIERFFKILADGKKLLSTGASGDFVLLLTLFKMLESMEIHTIDSMIHKLQNELSIDKNISQTAASESPKEREKPLVNKPAPQDSVQLAPQKEEPLTPQPQKLFTKLIKKIYDRNYDLGEIFQEHITFVSFENSTLTWESTLEGETKKRLIKNWPLIKLFVEEIFGLDTKISNLSKKKTPSNELKELPPAPQAKNPQLSQDIATQSKQEPIAQTNSCIMPEANSEASRDKDPNELLDEPMVQEFIKNLEPKRVIIKQKS